jgi:endonuclease I
MRQGHRKLSYSGLWTSYKSVWDNVDGKCGGKIYDIYSLKCWTKGNDQCGTYKREGDCYNREHSWPKSWWGGDKNTAYSDLFHVMPSDGYVNGKRSSHPFGDVASPSYTSSEGHKTGKCSLGTCFEPTDRVKGLVARGHLYVTTRYAGEISNSDLTGAKLATVMKWHNAFPPQAWEQDLNDRIQSEQGNRNPYIDYPETANDIFG